MSNPEAREASSSVDIDSKRRSVTLSKVNRSPYYKQCYRQEWESLPEYRGWLKSVPGEPTRAYCSYCLKTLHAHRLSLLKHTCTLKHTKAAQTQFNANNSSAISIAEPAEEKLDQSTLNDNIDGGQFEEGQDSMSDLDAREVNSEITENCLENQDQLRNCDDSKKLCISDTACTSNIDESNQNTAHIYVEKNDSTKLPVPQLKSQLSTHVLDLAKGNPVNGLQVCLYKLVDGRWTFVHEGYTNPDGRYNEFMKAGELTVGRYKLHFDVDRYFELRRQDSFYPFIEVVFDVKSPHQNYHIPLLLSPFGYSTYRGS